MKKWFYLIITFVLLFSFSSVRAEAQSKLCLDTETIEESLNNSSYVVRAVLSEKSGDEYLFKVIQIWNGTIDKTLTIYNTSGSPDVNKFYKVNKEYLLYVEKKGNLLSLNPCGKSKLWKDAKEDLKVLGEAKATNVPLKEKMDEKAIKESPVPILTGIVIFLSIALIGALVMYKFKKDK